MGYENGSEITLTELIRIDGALTKASLDVGVGKLRWLSGEKRFLEVESEVLGFETQGTRITIKAFVGETKGSSCGKSNGKRARRDFVLEMPTEECAVTWSEKLRNLINSFGRRFSCSCIFFLKVKKNNFFFFWIFFDFFFLHFSFIASILIII